VKKKIGLVIAIALIISALFLLKQKYQEYKYKKHYCELLIDGPDPYRGFPKGYAMRQYYHCVLSFREDINCYQKYRQEIIDCQSSNKEKMSEEEIKHHLTGGGMGIFCKDPAKECIAGQEGSQGDELLKKALIQDCIERTRKACDDLGLK